MVLWSSRKHKVRSLSQAKQIFLYRHPAGPFQRSKRRQLDKRTKVVSAFFKPMRKVISGLDSRVLGYATLRLAVGMSMLVHGVERMGHVAQFADGVAKMFAATWLPRSSVLGFAYLTPPVELAIGLMVLPGLFTRWGLLAGGLWMVALIFGSTLIEQYQTVGIQLIYSVSFWILLHFLEANLLSVDHWLATWRRRSDRR